MVLLTWNLHSIFPWWFLTLCTSEKVIRHQWRHYDVIDVIEIWNLMWLNLRSLLTNDHLAFCDYLHQSWNIRFWFFLSRENVFLHIKNMFLVYYICNFSFYEKLQSSDELNEKLSPIWNLIFQYGHSKFGSGTVIML